MIVLRCLDQINRFNDFASPLLCNAAKRLSCDFMSKRSPSAKLSEICGTKGGCGAYHPDISPPDFPHRIVFPRVG